MLDFLFRNLNDIYPLSDALKQDLEGYFEIVEAPKGYHLLRAGQRCEFVFVVITGLVRMYYIKDGEEVCSRFAESQQLILSVNSFYASKPGYEYIEAIEASVIARIHYQKLEQLYRKHIEFNFIARVITQQYFIRSEERLYLLRKQTAEQRYEYLCNKYPSVVQRVPLMYIATYLGMTIETLSRVRKKISIGGR
jgi:CRP/FNR family transcriptional regulator, anaerobic regulatory protein